jgi:hypothetical protein
MRTGPSSGPLPRTVRPSAGQSGKQPQQEWNPMTLRNGSTTACGGRFQEDGLLANHSVSTVANDLTAATFLFWSMMKPDKLGAALIDKIQ